MTKYPEYEQEVVAKFSRGMSVSKHLLVETFMRFWTQLEAVIKEKLKN